MHEARRTGSIHDALAAKGLAPSEHLVDSAYVSADHLIDARERHGIDLVGPARRNPSWQSRTGGAFDAVDFIVDWKRQTARCPEGKESDGWDEYAKQQGGRPYVRARFRASDCRGCPSRIRCTRSPEHGQLLALHPRREHEALVAARAREGRREGKRLYAVRRGVEGTLPQAVRAFGLRRACYRGLA